MSTVDRRKLRLRLRLRLGPLVYVYHGVGRDLGCLYRRGHTHCGEHERAGHP